MVTQQKSINLDIFFKYIAETSTIQVSSLTTFLDLGLMEGTLQRVCLRVTLQINLYTGEQQIAMKEDKAGPKWFDFGSGLAAFQLFCITKALSSQSALEKELLSGNLCVRAYVCLYACVFTCSYMHMWVGMYTHTWCSVSSFMSALQPCQLPSSWIAYVFKTMPIFLMWMKLFW